MTFEAAAVLGWAPTRIVQRLKQAPHELGKLRAFRQAVEDIPGLGVQVLTIPAHLVARAAALSQQTGLLNNDALIVAVMQHHGLTKLASNDADFDHVPGLTRYAPA
jgi:predicted nucleic acid-binding protein